MRVEIRLCIVYDTETGKAEVIKAAVSQGEAPLAQAFQEVSDQVSSNTPIADRPRSIGKARFLADQLGIDSRHLDDALGHRPHGRVLEVLEWMRQKKQTEKLRNPVGLFLSLVEKD